MVCLSWGRLVPGLHLGALLLAEGFSSDVGGPTCQRCVWKELLAFLTAGSGKGRLLESPRGWTSNWSGAPLGWRGHARGEHRSGPAGWGREATAALVLRSGALVPWGVRL